MKEKEVVVRKTSLGAVIAVVLGAILLAGGILASNMGFKISYHLHNAGLPVSKSGTNSLALPYIRRAGLTTSFDLLTAIEGHGLPFNQTIYVAKFLKPTDSLQVYTGRMGSPGANFLLSPGEGYRVEMSVAVNYVIVGVHDPSLLVSLDARDEGSKSGTNDFAPPYNLTATTALDLMKDIEGVSGPPFTKVVSVSKFLTATDSLQAYTGRMGSPGANFDLVPGESYRIQMSVTVPYVASHY